MLLVCLGLAFQNLYRPAHIFRYIKPLQYFPWHFLAGLFVHPLKFDMGVTGFIKHIKIERSFIHCRKKQRYIYQSNTIDPVHIDFIIH